MGSEVHEDTEKMIEGFLKKKNKIFLMTQLKQKIEKEKSEIDTKDFIFKIKLGNKTKKEIQPKEILNSFSKKLIILAENEPIRINMLVKCT